MVAPGNVKATGMRAPPGQGQRAIKAAASIAPPIGHQGTEPGAYQTPPRIPSSQHSTEVLHQRRKMPFSPARMAIGGFAAVAVLGYLTLYSKKKPEATATDVAKVVTATGNPESTRPRK